MRSLGAPGTPDFSKDHGAYAGVNSIITANDGNHSRIRRLLRHAFSDKALKEQEGLMRVRVETLISGLKTQIGRARSIYPIGTARPHSMSAETPRSWRILGLLK